MTIPPEGENIRRAVRWISAERRERPHASLDQLVEAACLKFCLSPLEADTLQRTLRAARTDAAEG